MSGGIEVRVVQASENGIPYNGVLGEVFLADSEGSVVLGKKWCLELVYVFQNTADCIVRQGFVLYI